MSFRSDSHTSQGTIQTVALYYNTRIRVKPDLSAQTRRMVPQIQGRAYDKSEMSLFIARLCYNATIDERRTSQDKHVLSISKHQAHLLQQWELLTQIKERVIENGGSLSPVDERQLIQYEWRYDQLEGLLNQSMHGIEG